MFTPSLAHLFTLRITAGAGVDFGQGPLGRRVFAPVTGGSFEGPRLKGTVAPHGGDWPIVTAPGRYRIDVRLHLVTDAGAAILMRYAGHWVMSPDVAARAFDPAAADGVGEDEQYFRTAVAFETGAADYAWLNEIVAVGTGRKTAEGVRYEIFEVT